MFLKKESHLKESSCLSFKVTKARCKVVVKHLHIKEGELIHRFRGVQVRAKTGLKENTVHRTKTSLARSFLHRQLALKRKHVLGEAKAQPPLLTSALTLVESNVDVEDILSLSSIKRLPLARLRVLNLPEKFVPLQRHWDRRKRQFSRRC